MATGSNRSQGGDLARDDRAVEEDAKSADAAQEEPDLIRPESSPAATPAAATVATTPSSRRRGNRRRPPSAGRNPRSEDVQRDGGGSVNLLAGSLVQSKDDEELVRALHVAAEDLVDRLFAFLSGLPVEDEHDDQEGGSDGTSTQSLSKGVTLPAAAVGWLVTRVL
jgi:hypothetical protein